MAGNLIQNDPALLVGIIPSTAKAPMNSPIPIATVAYAKDQFGVGQQLTRMVEAFFNNNLTQLIFAIGIPEPAAGIQATGEIAVTAVATQSGTYTVYIAGQKIQVAVLTTDTTNDIAVHIAQAINDTDDLPVTATVASSAGTDRVALTCMWKGETGNDIKIQENYGGSFFGEYMPVGMTTIVSTMAGGTGQPVFTNAIAAIADGDYVNVALPFTDAASLTTWATEYGFGPTGRWSYVRQQYGWIYSAHRSADFAAAITFGMTRNDPTISIMEIENATPSPVWEVAAAYCGRGSAALLDDPARPLQTLELMGITVAKRADRYNNPQLNNLTGNGLAIQRVNSAGLMMILREATTYQKNSYGQGDTAFSKLTILATLKTIIYRQRAAITSKFPRHKLAPDGTRFGPGQAIVTPKSIKAELIAEARIDEYDGLIADVPWMIQNMIVELDNHNPDRVNVLYPPRLIGQLRIFAVLAQFRLLIPEDSGITP
jgi:phage tail sheath gpL-like